MEILYRADCSPDVLNATQAILSRCRLRPQSALSKIERSTLRRAKIKKSKISYLEANELSSLTNLSLDRSRELVGLYKFQTLRSVGVAGSEDLWQLGYNLPQDLVGEHPYAMYFAYSSLVGEFVDRCVEDVFRCAVAQVETKNLPQKSKNWWAWKPYRGNMRFPNNRII
ncbi:hypothetical protein MNBD_ALPHA06-1491 [hydrothermal vent metagenome]|uniref:Uncharacterized protein n=1 Tax=hydrothermal vent metagenome TaxID=652676 RepID=A0A3B0S7K7_9ZZZZ